MPEKNDTVIMILAEPGTEKLLNFKYRAQIISAIENIKEIKPSKTPRYKGFNEYAVTPVINSLTGPFENKVNFDFLILSLLLHILEKIVYIPPKQINPGYKDEILFVLKYCPLPV